MREAFGKGPGQLPGGHGWMHLRYAAAKAPFGRLCFPDSLRTPSLGRKNEIQKSTGETR